ncbi:nuclease [Sesbania bispinosa]|nr:nuclease [Sesbania bispinosa]
MPYTADTMEDDNMAHIARLGIWSQTKEERRSIHDRAAHAADAGSNITLDQSESDKQNTRLTKVLHPT